MTSLFEKFNSYLREPGIIVNIAKRGEQFTGVPRKIFAIVLYVFIVVYLIKGYAPDLMSNSIVFVYPAYSTICSMQGDKIEEHKAWLKYWIIFAFFATFEFWVKNIIYYFPVYWLFKTILLMWCNSFWNFTGSVCIYDYVIFPMAIQAFEMQEKPSNYCTFFTLESFSRLLENVPCRNTRNKLFSKLESFLLAKTSNEDINEARIEDDLNDDDAVNDDEEEYLNDIVEFEDLEVEDEDTHVSHGDNVSSLEISEGMAID
ncbi:receptor expression-enhancing protein 5-like isoform X1 [Centruroides sculpturatus]|uniref:receptor expression-enhancing protein 5-like isoform X1 n=1 Tax=Centruroides sculpturatus TaxID=218467 RepID=UPI000C6DF5D9|nr:receptor expression-enhancing protein 5-like isoform X1 [Centruroides sculpturatus]